MTQWTRVKWTEARQITEALGFEPEEWPTPEVSPQDGLALFRQSRIAPDVLHYLGQALPRMEAIAWAAHVLERQAQGLAPLQRQALDRVLRWLGEPTDDYRRAAHDAAGRARAASAEQLLGLAVFLSGGSISEPDLPAVLPPPSACGRMAASAVLVACQRSADPEAAMEAAIVAGDRVARGGIEALADA